MENIRVLVLEDEALHAARLEILLEELGYSVIQIVDNAADAIRVFKATNPDLVILDIMVKGEDSGIDVAERILDDQRQSVPTIFLTSLNDRDTFEQAKLTKPYAFLLKPIDKFTLQHAVELALEKVAEEFEKEHVPSIQNGIFNSGSIFLQVDKKLVKIEIEKIEYVEVEAKYCSIFADNQRFVLRISLKELVQKLPPGSFLRAHRNYLVNTRAIVEVDLEDGIINLKSKSIPIGRSYKEAVLKSLSFLHG